MNPYKTKTGIGQKVINGLLIAGVALTLAATITVGVSQKDNIKAALNGMLGDNERVTFTQTLSPSHFLLQKDAMVTLSAGVLTVKGYENQAYESVNVLIYDPDFSPLLKSGVHYAIFAQAVGFTTGDEEAFLELCYGNPAQLLYTIMPEGAKPNVWSDFEGDVCLSQDSRLNFNTLVCNAKCSGAFRNFQCIDLSGLGLVGSRLEYERLCVWKKLAGTEYFEGDKTFTKGQIKAAIADYEKEQDALNASVAARSAAASSAAA
jgi:hypothetical protein